MTYKTHIATSMTLALIPYSLGLIELSDPIQYLIILAIIPIFALMPDLDEPNSYLSRRTPILPQLIRLFTTHRAFTHQFRATLIILLIAIIINYTVIDILIYLPALYISYLGHIIGDSMTLSGIRRFYYPLSKKTFFMLPKTLRFKTNGSTERFVVYPIAFVLMITSLYFFLLPLITEYELI